MYEIAATNLKMARERRDTIDDPTPIQLQPGDTVLVLNHTTGPFDPKYVGDYRVVSIKGNEIEVRPSIGGPTEMKHVKYVPLAEKYIKYLLHYLTFGRKTLRINPKCIPDLHWQSTDTYHTSIGFSALHMCTSSVDVNTLSFAGRRRYNRSGTSLHIHTIVTNSNKDAPISTDVYEKQ